MPPCCSITEPAYLRLDVALPASAAHRQRLLARELAQHTERLGFTRFWLAEHHDMSGDRRLPTVVIADVAEHDER